MYAMRLTNGSSPVAIAEDVITKSVPSDAVLRMKLRRALTRHGEGVRLTVTDQERRIHAVASSVLEGSRRAIFILTYEDDTCSE